MGGRNRRKKLAQELREVHKRRRLLSGIRAFHVAAVQPGAWLLGAPRGVGVVWLLCPWQWAVCPRPPLPAPTPVPSPAAPVTGTARPMAAGQLVTILVCCGLSSRICTPVRASSPGEAGLVVFRSEAASNTGGKFPFPHRAINCEVPWPHSSPSAGGSRATPPPQPRGPVAGSSHMWRCGVCPHPTHTACRAPPAQDGQAATAASGPISLQTPSWSCWPHGAEGRGTQRSAAALRVPAVLSASADPLQPTPVLQNAAERSTDAVAAEGQCCWCRLAQLTDNHSVSKKWGLFSEFRSVSSESNRGAAAHTGPVRSLI